MDLPALFILCFNPGEKIQVGVSELAGRWPGIRMMMPRRTEMHGLGRWALPRRLWGDDFNALLLTSLESSINQKQGDLYYKNNCGFPSFPNSTVR